jgi:RNA polymerase sigma factor (sigma-70 family)
MSILSNIQKHKKQRVVTQQEEELIKGCLAGKRAAQNRLFDKYAPKMLGVCFRYTQTTHEAEDVMQDGFVKVYNNLAGFRKESSLEAWIKRIMVNTALNHLKSTQRLRLEADIAVAENDIDISVVQLHEIDTEVLMGCIQQLPSGYRVVLNMFAIEGFSHKEIADQLGITESTSRSQFARAKEYLKKKLDALKKSEQNYEKRRVQ